MYTKGKNDLFKGQILMGSVNLGMYRNITDSGSTVFAKGTPPTLTLSGELDGLLRISRAAEAYWHGEINIDASQKG
jgi:hypothetical protein